MIIADKILHLRKKNNLSQEELAEKLGVSRQSVSKWESAQSIPDINKIMAMARLFGVSTDYLLKDEVETLEYVKEDLIREKMVVLEDAKKFVEASRNRSKLKALSVMCYIIAAIPLIFLTTLAEEKMFLSEDVASAIGLAFVLGLVTLGVVLEMISDKKIKQYKYIKKGNFELGFGVKGVIEESQRDYEPVRERVKVISWAMYILAAAPLVIVSNFEISEIIEVLLLVLLLLMVALATGMLIFTAGEKNAYKNLLSEGEYSVRGRIRSKKENRIDSIYWSIILAIYLSWSFLTNDWEISWIVWPIGLAINWAIVNIFVKEEDDDDDD